MRLTWWGPSRNHWQCLPLLKLLFVSQDRTRGNQNCLGRFREIPWNQTTDVHLGSTLITRVITRHWRYMTWRWRHRCHVNIITSVIAAKQTAFCLLLLPLWESVIVLCFVVRFSMSILVLQSSWWGRESWLLCLICLPGVSWWLSGSSSRCHGVVCSLWLWYFLIILIYYF